MRKERGNENFTSISAHITFLDKCFESESSQLHCLTCSFRITLWYELIGAETLYFVTWVSDVHACGVE